MARDGTYKPSSSVIVTIPVTPELHRRLRVHCAEEGRSMKWVGTKALERYIAHQDTMKRLNCVEDAKAPEHG